MARQGKIARLPHALREQVNQRLLDGQPAATILTWLNTKPEAITTWQTYFEGCPATPQNLSEWRQAGYRTWLAEREKVEATKSLAAFAASQAAAGQDLSSGLQSILAGHIMEGFDTLINATADPDQPDDPTKRIAALGSVISAMRNADTAAARVDLDKQKTHHREETLKLAREKFETQTLEKFLEYARTREAQEILNSGNKKSVQMADLRKLIFGTK